MCIRDSVRSEMGSSQVLRIVGWRAPAPRRCGAVGVARLRLWKSLCATPGHTHSTAEPSRVVRCLLEGSRLGARVGCILGGVQRQGAGRGCKPSGRAGRHPYPEVLNMDWRERIVTNPDILVGKPSVKGTRLSVELILGWLAQGLSLIHI